MKLSVHDSWLQIYTVWKIRAIASNPFLGFKGSKLFLKVFMKFKWNIKATQLFQVLL